MKKLFDSLNGWQRIGVVLSIFWFFIVGLFARTYDVSTAEKYANLSSQICYDSYRNGQTIDINVCGKEYLDNFNYYMRGSWGNSIAIAIIPIPIFWGIVILIIKVYRWIKKGFAK